MSTLDPLDPAERQTPLLFVWVFHVPEVVSWILPLVGDNQRAVPHWSCRNTDFGLRNIICNHCIDPPRCIFNFASDRAPASRLWLLGFASSPG